MKPGNILLSNDLTPKIADFGLSTLSNQSSNTTKTQHIGTLLYMCPEILLGKNYNEKSDVYSFSIIMWQLLFDETVLFHQNYTTNPKISTIMSKQEIETFSSLANQSSLLFIPKLISEGLRLPIPTLPINSHSQIMRMWIREYFVVEDFKFTNQGNVGNNLGLVDDPLDSYMKALDGLFSILKMAWADDFNNRPSFTEISVKLMHIKQNL